jgi:hypothetical protein
MAYREFDIDSAAERFDLTIDETATLFAAVPPLAVPPLLRMVLDEWTTDALADNTEKARSEGIIAPILRAAARLAPPPAHLFSGKSLDVDRDRGLNGVCDYVFTRSVRRYTIRSPVIAVAEAKNEDVIAGFGQCAAGMVAARVLNEREGAGPRPVFGVVTSGTNWKFRRLDGDMLRIDVPEYLLPDVGKILGVLVHMLGG